MKISFKSHNFYEAIDDLTPELRRIVQLRFFNGEKKTLREIGEIVGREFPGPRRGDKPMQRERVRQRLNIAIAKLRRTVPEWAGNPKFEQICSD